MINIRCKYTWSGLWHWETEAGDIVKVNNGGGFYFQSALGIGMCVIMEDYIKAERGRSARLSTKPVFFLVNNPKEIDRDELISVDESLIKYVVRYER